MIVCGLVMVVVPPTGIHCYTPDPGAMMVLRLSNIEFKASRMTPLAFSTLLFKSPDRSSANG